ncbi:MAG: HAD hydrolase family protein [Lachnospiraceae bacterium]
MNIFQTYQDTQILTNNPENRYAKLESRINHLKLKQVDNLEEYLDFPVPKFLMLDDGDYLALVEARVKAALGKNFSVYQSDPFFLEILPRNIDKAQSLAQLLKLLGMEREEMIACGDGYNDLFHDRVCRTWRSHGKCGSAGAQCGRLCCPVQQQ